MQTSILLQQGATPIETQFVDIPLYRLWPGKNRWACKGKVSCGPRKDSVYNICLWMTFIIPTVFFLALPAPIVWKEISPAITLVTAGLVVVALSLFLLTTFSDPGYIPRKEVQVALGIQDEVRKVLGIPSPSLISKESVSISDDGTIIVENEFDDRILLTEDLSLLGYKYCETCRIIRPPRASHCSECDNCCLRHDHHCMCLALFELHFLLGPFVNNCVGHRNYMIFTSFVLSMVILGLMILLSVIMWMSQGSDVFSSLTVKVIAFCVGIPVGLVLLAGIGFILYHSQLACRGETTRENLSAGRRPIPNPLPSGSSFFSARPPRLYPAFNTLVRIPRRSAIVAV